MKIVTVTIYNHISGGSVDCERGLSSIFAEVQGQPFERNEEDLTKEEIDETLELFTDMIQNEFSPEKHFILIVYNNNGSRVVYLNTFPW